MSTKQTVIVTFMILFLGTMLFSLGAWYHYSTELDTKLRTIEVLKDRKGALEKTLTGTVGADGRVIQKGLEPLVKNPVDGLEKQLEDEAARARNMLGDESKGVVQRQTLYDQKEKELGTKLDPNSGTAKAKWKALYDEWQKLNGDIDGAVKKLKAQGAEAEQKMAEAQGDLDREQAAEQTKKKEINEEKRKQQEDIGQIRATYEQVVDKIAEVTREARKEKTLARQGRVIGASEDVRLVTVDIGREQGVRKGLHFDVYSSALGGQAKKGTIEIAAVRASSSDATIVPPKLTRLQDPVTGWVPPDPRMKFSVFAAGGTDETSALELVKPKTREERIEAYRQDKLERELGAEGRVEQQKDKEAPSRPPPELGKGFAGIMAGDWINNPDFVPIMAERDYHKKAVQELLSLQDVNLSSLTFYFTEGVRPYRKEFLRRLCERNRCKTAEAMSADVSYVVTSPSLARVEVLEEKLQATKEKKDEEVPPEVRAQRRTLATLLEAKKLGAQLLTDDELESFFAKRQHKTELLRGTTVQPGRSTFFVAGETQERSVAQTRAWIKDHGGVPVEELTAGTDYVVAGSGLDQAFFDKVKKLGVKVIREDELLWYFGLQ